MIKLFLKSLLLKLMIAFVAFFMSSCQNAAPEPDGEVPQKQAVVPLLDQLVLADGSTMRFTYAGNRLMRIVHRRGTPDEAETNYSVQTTTTYDYAYSGEQLDVINILIENTTRLDGVTTQESLCRYIDFEGDGHGQARSLLYYLHDQPLRFQQEYNAGGYIKLQELQDVRVGLQETSYSWQEGNLRMVSTVSQPAFSNHSVSEYSLDAFDDNPNVLKPLATLWMHEGYKYLSKNNPTKISLRYTSGSATSLHVVYYEYEYNTQGYPVRLVERYPTGARAEVMRISYKNL